MYITTDGARVVCDGMEEEGEEEEEGGEEAEEGEFVIMEDSSDSEDEEEEDDTLEVRSESTANSRLDFSLVSPQGLDPPPALWQVQDWQFNVYN